jgi:hypothetical protein
MRDEKSASLPLPCGTSPSLSASVCVRASEMKNSTPEKFILRLCISSTAAAAARHFQNFPLLIKFWRAAIKPAPAEMKSTSCCCRMGFLIIIFILA